MADRDNPESNLQSERRFSFPAFGTSVAAGRIQLGECVNCPTKRRVKSWSRTRNHIAFRF
jgi:hypothetical protein